MNIEKNAMTMIHPPIVRTLFLADTNATQALAMQWAQQKEIANIFVALHGTLGAGKTTFVRFLLQALGVTGRIKSPTYAVVEPYVLPDVNIWHFDFYRFTDPCEWEDAGFRDIFASPGLKIAEWPEKVGDLLPIADIHIFLNIDTNMQNNVARTLTISVHTRKGQALMDAINPVEITT
ncbi:MAG: hypothetical protein RIR79_2225 [Pseudomonadota bacterium]